MKHPAVKSSGCFFWVAIWLLMMQSPYFGESRKNTGATPANYLALPFNNSAGIESNQKIIYHYGIPFLEGRLNMSAVGASRIGVRLTAKCLFILGMMEDANIRAWADPRDYSVRYFLGDELGEIRLQYTDGSVQTFPLILGESIWWGKLTGRFWYSTGDLGNRIQEAEIVKTLRLVIGVDDTQPNRTQFFPRMPMAGKRWRWKNIQLCSNAEARSRPFSCVISLCAPAAG